MSLDADHIVDRRRMRRKLTFWRVVAVLVAIVAVVGGGAGRGGAAASSPAGGDQIARVTDPRPHPRRPGAGRGAGRAGEVARARAVIVHINSPGGTTAGSEQLHEALRRLAAQKPMVVVVDGLAASGGYIAAMAADHIVAQRHLAGRLDRRPVPVSQRRRAPQDRRRQGRGDQVLAAQGGAERLRADQPGGARGDRSRSSWTPMTGSAAWCATAASSTATRSTGSPTAACSPAARASTSSSSTQLGNEKTAIDWLAKEKGIDAKTAGPRLGAEIARSSELSFLHLAVRQRCSMRSA